MLIKIKINDYSSSPLSNLYVLSTVNFACSSVNEGIFKNSSNIIPCFCNAYQNGIVENIDSLII